MSEGNAIGLFRRVMEHGLPLAAAETAADLLVCIPKRSVRAGDFVDRKIGFEHAPFRAKKVDGLKIVITTGRHEFV